MVLILTLIAAGIATWGANSAATAAQDAAKAAWKQVETSNQQIRESRKSTMIAQRAYVYASPSEVFHVKGGSPLEGFVEIGNSGQTFARNVRRWVGMTISSGSLPNTMGGLGIIYREEGVLSINPRVSHLVRRKLPKLEPDQITELHKSDGPLRIYIFGIIRYEDIFGEPHITQFCHMYFGGNFIEIQKSNTIGYWRKYAKYCDKYNSAT